MTKDEILNMPAGRELDALVAEKVMGWTLRQDGIYVSDPKDNSLFGTLWGVNSEAPYLFDPSESIAAAWLVVEKIISDGDGAGFALSRLFRPVFWEVSFDFSEAIADTAPLAICRASLLAVLEL